CLTTVSHEHPTQRRPSRPRGGDSSGPHSAFFFSTTNSGEGALWCLLKHSAGRKSQYDREEHPTVRWIFCGPRGGAVLHLYCCQPVPPPHTSPPVCISSNRVRRGVTHFR